ncbi:hypothetical protein [Paenibacillus sacheonensis]|uniref:Flp pilus assembly protein, ATPase CpaE n=1 Tax=Paenibacillus sacheonensis TaxID=742054 RepID=A0A7X4YP62_9BACL|nr:hypothetical protein [Paenibacillus sacheonensis]MBM7565253.1 hypothetical protein [Paenibacillus sacheonensis]NBC69971.1 hypothetical protein [Paenibacillus sacheonensis]
MIRIGAGAGNAAPLIAFVGTTPNIGTSSAAFAAACRIAEESGGTIGFLCLNLKSAKMHRYLGVDDPAGTLDELRPELATRTLHPEKLLRAMHRCSRLTGVHVLFGNLLRDQAEYYAMEEMEHLLDAAAQAFDVVIADVGAYWDNAATLCALRRAATRILVTTGALSHFQEDGQRWAKQLAPLYGIPAASFQGLVIHSPWGKGGFHVKDICKELGVPLLGEHALSEQMLASLDSGTLEEWLADNERGRRAMLEPAKTIAAAHGLRRQRKLAMQPWYKKLLVHRGEVSS